MGSGEVSHLVCLEFGLDLGLIGPEDTSPATASEFDGVSTNTRPRARINFIFAVIVLVQRSERATQCVLDASATVTAAGAGTFSSERAVVLGPVFRSYLNSDLLPWNRAPREACGIVEQVLIRLGHEFSVYFSVSSFPKLPPLKSARAVVLLGV